MKKVTIYSTRICPYCMRAKNLLDKKNISYDEIRIDENPEEMENMIAKSKRQSVPQIFIGDHHVGGNVELQTLEREGKLDSLVDI